MDHEPAPYFEHIVEASKFVNNIVDILRYWIKKEPIDHKLIESIRLLFWLLSYPFGIINAIFWFVFSITEYRIARIIYWQRKKYPIRRSTATPIMRFFYGIYQMFGVVFYTLQLAQDGLLHIQSTKDIEVCIYEHYSNRFKVDTEMEIKEETVEDAGMMIDSDIETDDDMDI